MSDDDPIADRTIRVAGTVITLHGELSHVDALYRLCTKAMLETGKYTIPKPGDDPWRDYERSTPPHSPDFLRRRNAELERQLAESENHETIRQLRIDLAAARIETGVYRQGFTALSDQVESAISSLTDDPDPNLYNHVAVSFLSGE